MKITLAPHISILRDDHLPIRCRPAGMKLLLDCKEKGYRVHMDINGAPDVGDADASQAYPLLIRRVIAECNSIIKTEAGIQSRRNAQESAEEKRKNVAYERAHPTN